MLARSANNMSDGYMMHSLVASPCCKCWQPMSEPSTSFNFVMSQGTPLDITSYLLLPTSFKVRAATNYATSFIDKFASGFAAVDTSNRIDDDSSIGFAAQRARSEAEDNDAETPPALPAAVGHAAAH